MSSDLALDVRGLAKSYSIAMPRPVGNSSRGLLQKLRSRTARTTFWALREVSFEVRQGEVLGIIGRNGAGKSTLLKILSQIARPSEGEVDLYGRVGSLLEVGTGFHPELTGRENIFLNGSILGMRRHEIERQFDEIVAFAEVEPFLETPVRRYSSGMYVRLAFAVAAHLASDILIVDEVLAVGDASFQKKCLGKMQDASSLGRTVLFVSHNMPIMLRLCSRALLLEEGRIVADGAPEAAAKRYLLSSSGSTAQRAWQDDARAPGDEVARLYSVRVLDERGQDTEIIDIERGGFIEIEYWQLDSKRRPIAAFHLINGDGIVAFASADFNSLNARDWGNRQKLIQARCRIPGNLLAEGHFTILAAVCSYNPNIVHAIERDAVAFQVLDRSQGQAARGDFAGGDWPGVLRPLLQWEVTHHTNRAHSAQVSAPLLAANSGADSTSGISGNADAGSFGGDA